MWRGMKVLHECSGGWWEDQSVTKTYGGKVVGTYNVMTSRSQKETPLPNHTAHQGMRVRFELASTVVTYL